VTTLLRKLGLGTLIVDGLLVATLLIDRLLGLIVIVYGAPLAALALAAWGLVLAVRGRASGVPLAPAAILAIAIPAVGCAACFAVAWANRVTHL
jgi:hypothetical protein